MSGTPQNKQLQQNQQLQQLQQSQYQVPQNNRYLHGYDQNAMNQLMQQRFGQQPQGLLAPQQPPVQYSFSVPQPAVPTNTGGLGFDISPYLTPAGNVSGMRGFYSLMRDHPEMLGKMSVEPG